MSIATLSVNFDRVEEDWTGLSDQKKRRVLQNRINQRKQSACFSLSTIYCTQTLIQIKERVSFTQSLQYCYQTVRRLSTPEDLIESAGYRLILEINPARSTFLHTGLNTLEWKILLYGMM